jgi:hypothetical protein
MLSAGPPVRLSALSVLSALFAVPLHAQQTAQVSGRVVRATATDTVGVPGVQVMLHAVGRTRQGPVDSTVAGPNGEFRFRFRADTSSVYLLSSGWAGIEYFSTPVRSVPTLPDTGLLLVVSDTSSAAPVGVVSRHIVIGKPRADGIRAALEIVVLQNNGPLTRVAKDSLQPTWTTRLPSRAFGFQPGEGDVSADALAFQDGAVQLFAPIAPGEKQLLYTYQLPSAPGTVRIPLQEPVGAMNILLEEFDRTVTGGAIEQGDSQAIEGRSFRQWSGAVPAGSVIAIHFPSIGNRWVLPALVSAVALSLGFVAIRALRGRAQPALPRPAAPLLDQLARLDAQYRDREGQVPAEEWTRYQADRKRLKEELSRQLAETRPPT